MKTFLLKLFLLFIMTGHAQDKDYKGAYKVYNLDAHKADSIPKKQNTKTTDVALYDGDKHPVYIDMNGKLFIWVQSKTEPDCIYKIYIKE
jgi:hypothetical protein